MIPPIRVQMPYIVKKWARQFRADELDAGQEFALWELEGQRKFTSLFYRIMSQGLRSYSLDKPAFSDNNDATLIDMIPFTAQETDDTENIVKKALLAWHSDGTLTDAQSVAVYYYIVEQWSFERIGTEFETSPSSVRFHFVNGIRRLQERYDGRVPKQVKERVLPKGADHYASKVNERKVIEIRRRYAAGEGPQTLLADEYGIDQTTVSQIVNRKIWKDVIDPLERIIDVDVR